MEREVRQAGLSRHSCCYTCNLFQKGRAGRGHATKLPSVQARDNGYLSALDTLQGVLLLVAGHTEVLLFLRDEALGSNRLLAAVADEAGLVPAAALILHLAGACHESQEEQSSVVEMTGLGSPQSALRTCHHLVL